MDQTRLDSALKKRDDLAAKKQRIQGRHEAAVAKLAEVEEEIRAKKIEPKDLSSAIEKLKTKYNTLIEQIEADVEAAEQAITPFLEEK